MLSITITGLHACFDNVSRSWMCNTLIMTVTYEENKIVRDDKSPYREPLLLPYSLSELQIVENGRTWDLRSEMKFTSYWFVWLFWIQGNLWQPVLSRLLVCEEEICRTNLSLRKNIFHLSTTYNIFEQFKVIMRCFKFFTFLARVDLPLPGRPLQYRGNLSTGSFKDVSM